MQLKNAANAIVVPHLEVADSFWSRTKGLLGRANLPEGRGLWIKRCNSIHTFFMSFTIDVIFMDSQMRVRKTYSRVRPWRLLFPVWSATSVIELCEGFLDKHPVTIGEQLHVDRPLS